MRKALLAALSTTLACAGVLDPSAPAWVEVSTPGPGARWGHVSVVDPVRSRVLVFGGMGPNGVKRGDLWAYSLADRSWQEITSPGGPSPRITAGAVLDAARDRMVVVGGEAAAATSEVWALDLASHGWTLLPGGPTPRFDVAAATDGSRAWFYAGFSAPFATLDDLWELDLTTDQWQQVSPVGELPPARSNVGMAYFDGALYVTGGHEALHATPDTWRYLLADNRWEKLHATGAPAAAAHYAYTADPDCGVLWIAGGDNVDYYDVAFTSSLALSGQPAFRFLPASALPPPRRHATLVYDAATRQLVLVGGWQGMATVLGDTWTYAPRSCP